MLTFPVGWFLTKTVNQTTTSLLTCTSINALIY